MSTITVTIEVPESTCARCGATAALQPQLVRLQDGAWQVQPSASLRPAGWTPWPTGASVTDPRKGLCGVCSTAYAQSLAAFLASPVTRPAAQPAPPVVRGNNILPARPVVAAPAAVPVPAPVVRVARSVIPPTRRMPAPVVF